MTMEEGPGPLKPLPQRHDRRQDRVQEGPSIGIVGMIEKPGQRPERRQHSAA